MVGQLGAAELAAVSEAAHENGTRHRQLSCHGSMHELQHPNHN
jgi:hypothetical protein